MKRGKIRTKESWGGQVCQILSKRGTLYFKQEFTQSYTYNIYSRIHQISVTTKILDKESGGIGLLVKSLNFHQLKCQGHTHSNQTCHVLITKILQG